MISMCIINTQTICDVIPHSSFAQLIDKQEQESLNLPTWLALNVILPPPICQSNPIERSWERKASRRVITSVEKKEK